MSVQDVFARVLQAEWTKFRTVRAWVIGTLLAALMIVLVAVLAGVSGNPGSAPAIPIGPGGEPVTDSFYFVHRTLDGDGSITISVAELTDHIASGPAGTAAGIVPWAKAGLILKDGTREGSLYAAIMVTTAHGVRMQDGYVNDTAGRADPVSRASPRWLRLERSGDEITGSESTDGTHWTTVGTVRLNGLGSSVEGGLFVASPPTVDGLGTVPSVSTATFDEVRTQGTWRGDRWTGEQVGAGSPSFAGYPRDTSGSFTDDDGRFTVTGAGDIAPAVRLALTTGGTLADLLTGTFPALITVIVIGALFVTTEYRDNLLSVTLTASSRRSHVLAAKAIVLGGVTFVAGLAGSAVAVRIGTRLAHSSGVYLFPTTLSTEVRIVVGTAALLAISSILGLAVGAIFRSSAAAVTAVAAVIVLPYLLVAQNPFLPAGVANGLARATPAAAFAVQQTLEPHHQVMSIYSPYNGYYPLAPWAGPAVLAGYTAASLVVATVILYRRDA